MWRRRKRHPCSLALVLVAALHRWVLAADADPWGLAIGAKRVEAVRDTGGRTLRDLEAVGARAGGLSSSASCGATWLSVRG